MSAVKQPGSVVDVQLNAPMAAESKQAPLNRCYVPFIPFGAHFVTFVLLVY